MRTPRICSNILYPEGIQFDLTPPLTINEGLMYWNSDAGTLNLGMPGGSVNLQIGQEMLLPRRVKNNSGVDIKNGELVYISGGDGVNCYITKAQADTEATSANTIAMATEDIDDGEKGYCTTYGLVRGETAQPIDTSGGSAGDVLYLSPTVAGGFTTTKPSAPNHLVVVGHIFRSSATEGIVLVNIKNGFEVDELHDVAISSIADNDILQYDSASGVWANTGSPAFSGLTVTNLTGTYIPYSNTGVLTDSSIRYTAGNIVIDSDVYIGNEFIRFKTSTKSLMLDAYSTSIYWQYPEDTTYQYITAGNLTDLTISAPTKVVIDSDLLITGRGYILADSAGHALDGTFSFGASQDASIGWVASGYLDITSADTRFSGTIAIPATADANTGVIEQPGGTRLIHTYGTANIFLGSGAGNFTTSGTGNNVAIGSRALESIGTGYRNFALGAQALRDCTTSFDNIAIGAQVMQSLTTAANGGNIGIGFGVMSGGTPTGYYNTCIGRAAGFSLTSGYDNTFLGAGAGDGTQGGLRNVAIGSESFSAAGGNYNTCIGYKSGYSITGNSNICIGGFCGDAISSGSTNIVIGYNVDVPTASGSNQLNIGGILTSSNYTTHAKVEGTIFIKETASGGVADVAGYGQLYCKDNAGTTELWFIDDSGTETQLA